MRPSFATFQISWRAYTEKGQEWVEETIGFNSTSKVLYGPTPDRKTSEELIAERKEQVTQLYLSIVAATKDKFEKPKLVGVKQ